MTDIISFGSVSHIISDSRVAINEQNRNCIHSKQQLWIVPKPQNVHLDLNFHTV